MMSKPLRPNDFKKAKAEREFPPYVFAAFNNVITRNITDSGFARVTQEEALVEVQTCAFHKHGVELTRNQIYDQHLLDVEEAYRAQGWKVEYDKPAYCESYSAFFTFRAPK